MTKTSKRTHPLDRDGDGKPGGSLPGNQTAPMSSEEAAKVEAINAETDAKNAEERAKAGWTRDEARLLAKLDDLGARFGDLSNEAVVQSWNDQEAFTAERFADAMLAEGRYTSDDGEEFNADGTPISLPPVLAEWEIDFRPPAPGETFTAEEVAAGGGTIDMAAAHDAIDAAFADSPDDQDDDDATPAGDEDEPEAPLNSEDDEDEEPGLDASADRTQVAARIRDLTILVGARRLYKSDEGYSSNYGAPYVGHDTIAAFIQAGLAEDIPSAGNQGGVKLTAEARRMLADLKREATA